MEQVKITIRPISPQEKSFCYTQSHQLMIQTGSIGYLRADFGSSGESFHSTWFDHRKELKNDAFVAEFDKVINALRENEEYGGILRGRDDMRTYCKANAAAFKGSYTTEYGVRVDTEHYSYLLRMNPLKGDYNLYCYCYVKLYLDHHLKQAERGIRFITPDYKEKFRIEDGDQIRIVRFDGEKRDIVCRYIDDYHFQLGFGGDNLYHICQFAEKMVESDAQEIIPIRASLPPACCSYLESTDEIIYITRGERGYLPQGPVPAGRSPREVINEINEAAGITRAQEEAMLVGAMFGFHVPGADPKNYNADGTPIPPNRKERDNIR